MSFQENFLQALQEGINQCGGQQAFAAKSGVAQSSLSPKNFSNFFYPKLNFPLPSYAKLNSVYLPRGRKEMLPAEIRLKGFSQ